MPSSTSNIVAPLPSAHISSRTRVRAAAAAILSAPVSARTRSHDTANTLLSSLHTPPPRPRLPENYVPPRNPRLPWNTYDYEVEAFGTFMMSVRRYEPERFVSESYTLLEDIPDFDLGEEMFTEDLYTHNTVEAGGNVNHMAIGDDELKRKRKEREQAKKRIARRSGRGLKLSRAFKKAERQRDSIGRLVGKDGVRYHIEPDLYDA